jgi:hypothetical protein
LDLDFFFITLVKFFSLLLSFFLSSVALLLN